MNKKLLILSAVLSLSAVSVLADDLAPIIQGPVFEKTVYCWGNYNEKDKFACAYGLAAQDALGRCRKAGCQICAVVAISPAGIIDNRYGGYAQIQGMNCAADTPAATN